jgi:hypothetical protein
MAKKSIPLAVAPSGVPVRAEEWKWPLSFSFQFTATDHWKFNYRDVDYDYCELLVQALLKYRSFLAVDVKEEKFNLDNTHRIRWDYPTISEHSWGLDEELEATLSLGWAWQLCVQGDKKNRARLHGVMLGSVFYVIWLDGHHRLYSPSDPVYRVPTTAADA